MISDKSSRERQGEGPCREVASPCTRDAELLWGASHTSGSPLCTEDLSKLSTTLRSPSSGLLWGSPAGAEVISAPLLRAHVVNGGGSNGTTALI